MDFFKENRLVWNEAPDAAPAPEAENAETPAEQDKAQDVEAAREKVDGTVASAKDLIEQIKSVYVDEEYGIDTKGDSNDAAVTRYVADLEAALTKMGTDFEDGISKLTSDYETQLAKLDEDLMSQILEAAGGTVSIEEAVYEGVSAEAGRSAEEVKQDLSALKERQEVSAKFQEVSTSSEQYNQWISDFTKAYPDADTGNLSELLGQFMSDVADFDIESVSVAEIEKKSQDFEEQFYAKALELSGEKTVDAMKSKVAAKPKTDDEPEPEAQTEEPTEILQIPEYQLERATELLKSKTDPIESNGGEILGDRNLRERSITGTDDFTIVSSVEQGESEAFLIKDFSKTKLTQTFDSEKQFQKHYKHLGEDFKLPDAGQSVTVTEDFTLSASKPPPFGGLKRRRTLQISVSDNGKVSVEASNIQFAGPDGTYSSQVRIPLGKNIDDIKNPEDILYPEGYRRPGSYGGETPSSESESADDASVESSENLTEEDLDTYAEELTDLQTLLENSSMEQIDLADSRLADLPEFLKTGWTDSKGDTIKLDSISYITRTGLLAMVNKTLALIGKHRAAPDEQLAKDISANMEKVGDLEAYARVFAGDQESFKDIPQVRRYESFKTRGLQYGPQSAQYKNADVYFSRHFSEAHQVLTKKFEHATIDSANIIFKGEGASKQLSGTFTLGFGSEKLTFNFNQVDETSSTWEEAMTKAMKSLKKDRATRKEARKLNKAEKKSERKEDRADRKFERKEVRPLERKFGVNVVDYKVHNDKAVMTFTHPKYDNAEFTYSADFDSGGTDYLMLGDGRSFRFVNSLGVMGGATSADQAFDAITPDALGGRLDLCVKANHLIHESGMKPAYNKFSVGIDNIISFAAPYEGTGPNITYKIDIKKGEIFLTDAEEARIQQILAQYPDDTQDEEAAPAPTEAPAEEVSAPVEDPAKEPVETSTEEAPVPAEPQPEEADEPQEVPAPAEEPAGEPFEYTAEFESGQIIDITADPHVDAKFKSFGLTLDDSGEILVLRDTYDNTFAFDEFTDKVDFSVDGDHLVMKVTTFDKTATYRGTDFASLVKSNPQ